MRATSETPWWYPSITGSGAIREDRLVLPIPEGQHWSETRPTVLPGISETIEVVEEVSQTTTEADVVPVPALAEGRGASGRAVLYLRATSASMTAEMIAASASRAAGRGGLFMVPMDVKLVREMPLPVLPVARRKRKTVEEGAKAKHDPRLASAVRELRDRWLEHVNAATACCCRRAGEVRGGAPDEGGDRGGRSSD